MALAATGRKLRASSRLWHRLAQHFVRIVHARVDVDSELRARKALFLKSLTLRDVSDCADLGASGQMALSDCMHGGR